MAQQNQFNFTKKAIQQLPHPAGSKRSYYRDTKSRGLSLCITSAGACTFQFYRWVKGAPRRITLGRFPDLTIEQARRKTDQLNADIANGEFVAGSDAPIRDNTTLQALFEEFLERHAKLHKKTWAEDVSMFRRYLQPWRNRKIGDIDTGDVQALHAKIGKRHGRYAANRMLALLRVMFNKAKRWGWRGSNPARHVTQFKEKTRERYLSPDELPRFFKALAEEPDATLRDLILISLLTGARQGNVRCMIWEQLDLQAGIWRIPDTKNGEPHTIPLVAEAIKILEARQQRRNGDWVFPSKAKSGHIEQPKRSWERLIGRAGIKDLRLHDLRRTLGSWQAATGASLSVIGKSLAHKSVTATAIYARLHLDPVREAMTTATKAMYVAGGLEEEAKVVNIGVG